MEQLAGTPLKDIDERHLDAVAQGFAMVVKHQTDENERRTLRCNLDHSNARVATLEREATALQQKLMAHTSAAQRRIDDVQTRVQSVDGALKDLLARATAGERERLELKQHLLTWDKASAAALNALTRQEAAADEALALKSAELGAVTEVRNALAVSETALLGALKDADEDLKAMDNMANTIRRDIEQGQQLLEQEKRSLAEEQRKIVSRDETIASLKQKEATADDDAKKQTDALTKACCDRDKLRTDLEASEQQASAAAETLRVLEQDLKEAIDAKARIESEVRDLRSFLAVERAHNSRLVDDLSSLKTKHGEAEKIATACRQKLQEEESRTARLNAMADRLADAQGRASRGEEELKQATLANADLQQKLVLERSARDNQVMLCTELKGKVEVLEAKQREDAKRFEAQLRDAATGTETRCSELEKELGAAKQAEDKLQAKCAKQAQELKFAVHELVTAKAGLADKEAWLSNLRSQLGDSGTEKAELKKRVAALESGNGKHLEQNRMLENLVCTNNDQIKQLTADVQKTRQQLEDSERNRSAAEAKSRDAAKALEDCERERSAADAKAQRIESTLAARDLDLMEKKQQLTTAAEGHTGALRKLSDELSCAKDHLSNTKEQLSTAERQVASLASRNTDLERKLVEARSAGSSAIDQLKGKHTAHLSSLREELTSQRAAHECAMEQLHADLKALEERRATEGDQHHVFQLLASEAQKDAHSKALAEKDATIADLRQRLGALEYNAPAQGPPVQVGATTAVAPALEVNSDEERVHNRPLHSGVASGAPSQVQDDAGQAALANSLGGPPVAPSAKHDSSALPDLAMAQVVVKPPCPGVEPRNEEAKPSEGVDNGTPASPWTELVRETTAVATQSSTKGPGDAAPKGGRRSLRDRARPAAGQVVATTRGRMSFVGVSKQRKTSSQPDAARCRSGGGSRRDTPSTPLLPAADTALGPSSPDDIFDFYHIDRD